MITNKICQLFKIKYPIIQAGMVWCSGWKLASAVSNAGGLGIIGAGSMNSDTLREHIQKFKKNSNAPYAVNLPLLYSHVEEQIDLLIEEKVPIVFTSAGNPSLYTKKLKEAGIIVVHVVSALRFAEKAEKAGVDAIVAEGFEAGGHNGKDETTTMVLIPLIKEKVKLPLIAAGGIGCGRSMAAARCLGADAVQIGSLFASAEESSAHQAFKDKVIHSKEGDTELVLKQLNPVRLLKSPFYEQVKKLEGEGSSAEVLKEFLSKGRAKKGIFEGNWEEGEWEIGQISARIQSQEKAADIVNRVWQEYQQILKESQAWLIEGSL